MNSKARRLLLAVFATACILVVSRSAEAAGEKGGTLTPAAGKIELKDGKGEIRGQLATTDPKDVSRKNSFCKVYTIKLEAGKNYQFLCISVWDNWLRLEDAKGKQLAEDDDSGGGTNAQIVFECKTAGEYRLIVTTFEGGGVGTFTLTANQAPEKRAKSDVTDAPLETTLQLLVPRERKQRRPVLVMEMPIERGDTQSQFRGILARELVRQAFALCVREEFGLVTRDKLLHESFPQYQDFELKGTYVLKSSIIKDQPAVVTLEKKTGMLLTPLFKIEIPAVKALAYDYTVLARQMESIARTKWPPVLKKEGFPVDVTAKNPAVKADADTQRRLNEMNYVDQFAAVRELHIQMRRDGESPWLVGDLVRGYAQLGRLTDFHWNTAHKAYWARALLYATRLEVQAPNSPWGHWHQAYAAALAGLPEACMKHLEGAELRTKTYEPAIEIPSWTGTIKSWCLSDPAALAKQSTSLARFLEVSVVEEMFGEQRGLAAALVFLEKNPHSYAMWDFVSASKQLGVLHKVTLDAPSAMDRGLPERLRKFPNLPGAVTELINTTNEIRGESEIGLQKALKESAKLERDVDEMSWSGLAGLFRETRWAQVYRRSRFLAKSLAVPSQPYYRESLPLIKDHPLLPILTTMTEPIVSKRDALWRNILPQIDPAQTPVSRAAEWIYYLDAPDKVNKPGTRLVREHADDTTDDLNELIVNAPTNEKKPFAHRLRAVDTHSTIALGALITDDWASIKNEAEGWEKLYADRPRILRSLGVRYVFQKRYADAERCYKQYVAITPDVNGYTQLAGIYKAQMNDEKWLETWEEFSKLPSLGLEQAKARVTIADYYMSKKDFKKALPYAEGAAQTGAGWAMMAAHRCREGLGDWNEAEQLVRAVSERYASEGREWYRWCMRTGRGDFRAAALHGLKTGGRVGSKTETSWMKVHMYILSKNPKGALQVFENDEAMTASPEWYLFQALLAYEAKDPAKRDAALKRLPADSSLAPLVVLFQDRLANPKAAFDAERIDKKLQDRLGKGEFGAYYLVGRILDLTGEPKQSDRYYQRSLQSEQTPITLRPLAIHALRAHGQEPDLGGKAADKN